MKKENHRKITILISLVFAIVIIFTFVNSRPTFADSGFSASYSGGSTSGSSGDGESWTIIPEIVFVILIIIWSIMNIGKGKKDNQYVPGQPYIPVQNNIEKQIKKYIPDFEKTQFLNNGYKMYCEIQQAIANSKLEEVKGLLADELYNDYKSQLETLETKGQQNIINGFILNSSYLRDVKNQNNTLIVTAGYVIEFYDYIIDKNTRKTIKGDVNNKIKATYEMKFRISLDQNKKMVLTEKKSLNQYYL